MSKLKTIAILSALTSSVSFANAEITVYSGRNAKFIEPIIAAYTKATNVKVNLESDKENVLINKIKENGANNKADVLLLADSGVLWQAVNAGITQDIDIDGQNVAPKYVVTKSFVPTSIRVRTIVYNSELVKASDLSSYADLSSEKWRGKLCLRTSGKIYNQSLVSALHKIHGEQTGDIVKGWIANLAAPVFANDTALIEAIEAGTCQVGIVNNYYFVKAAAANPKVKLFMANQKQNGVLANISGAILLKNAPNKNEGQKFITWLTSAEGQKLIADGNFELRITPNKTPVHPIKQQNLAELKELAAAKLDVTALNSAKDLAPALNLIKEANWQ